MYQSYNKQLHKAELGSDNGAWNFGMYWLRPNLDHRKLSKSWKTGLDRLSFWESIWPLTSYFRFTHQISLFFTQKNAFLQPFTEIHILPLQLHVVGHGSIVVWQGTDLSCSSYRPLEISVPTSSHSSAREVALDLNQASCISNNGGFTNPVLQCLLPSWWFFPPLISTCNFPHCNLCPLPFTLLQHTSKKLA